jgi:CHAT domain-containing protein
MKTFYGLLKTGRSKDEALQAAQIGMIRGAAAAAHPYRWAAFEIIGDWR